MRFGIDVAGNIRILFGNLFFDHKRCSEKKKETL